MSIWKEAIDSFARKVGAEKHPIVIGAKVNRDNVFRLKDKLLIVKINLTDEPWWGLHAHAAETIEAENGFLVLLLSDVEGSLLTAREVNERIEDASWRLASDGLQYKIHPRDLPRHSHFSSPGQFLAAIHD
jgi:hypothetical protein